MPPLSRPSLLHPATRSRMPNGASERATRVRVANQPVVVTPSLLAPRIEKMRKAKRRFLAFLQSRQVSQMPHREGSADWSQSANRCRDGTRATGLLRDVIVGTDDPDRTPVCGYAGNSLWRGALERLGQESPG